MSTSVQRRLQAIIDRLQKIQQEIAADEQPVSMLQLDEMTRLGTEYAELLEFLQGDKPQTQSRESE